MATPDIWLSEHYGAYRAYATCPTCGADVHLTLNGNAIHAADYGSVFYAAEQQYPTQESVQKRCGCRKEAG